MKLVITGATGGIGRNLTEVLKHKHEIIGIVRSINGTTLESTNVSYISYSDRARVDECIAHADAVIHCALDTKVTRKEFLSANLDLTRHILDKALNGTCKLFVYLSSQVVYAGIEPGERGYNEAQSCHLLETADDYTRLKLLSEQMVMSACQNANLNYLILRPTFVIGDGFFWADGMVSLSKWLPLGIKHRSMNLIHVTDLVLFVDKLLDLGICNEVFNVGQEDYASEYYFGCIGKMASRNIIFIPDRVMRLLGKLIPSTLWLFKANVTVDCEKIKQVTGIRPARALEDIIRLQAAGVVRAGSLETLQQVQRSPGSFRAYGIGYAALLNPPGRVGTRVFMDLYRGIVSLEGELVTVKAGTLLSDVTKFLDQHGLTLATLPEFTGNTAGACFFVDVHGSSAEYLSLYDLIVEIKYLDSAGNVVISKIEDGKWEELRQSVSGFILTELTFRCEPAGYLVNKIEWKDDSCLLGYIATEHRMNMSTTVQWYPVDRKCLIYNVNRANVAPRRFSKAKTLYRHMPYRIVRFIIALRMRGCDVQYDRYHNILAPMKNVPLRRFLVRIPEKPKGKQIYDIELCVSLEDGVRFIASLQERIRSHEIRFANERSVGLRFGYRKDEAGVDRGFVWIELVCPEFRGMEKFVSVARDVCKGGVMFHRGKYLPKGEFAGGG